MQEKKPRTTTASSRYSLGEAASLFEGSERDVVSETGAVGKLCPGMGEILGHSFPFITEEGALPAVDADGAPFWLSYVEA